MSITLAAIMGSTAYAIVKDALLMGTAVTSAVDLGLSAATRSDVKDLKSDVSYIRSNIIKSSDLQEFKLSLRGEFDALRGDVQLVGQQVGFGASGIATTVENGALQAVTKEYYLGKVMDAQPAIAKVNQQLSQLPPIDANGHLQANPTPQASASVTVNTQPAVAPTTNVPVSDIAGAPAQAVTMPSKDEIVQDVMAGLAPMMRDMFNQFTTQMNSVPVSGGGNGKNGGDIGK